MRITIEPSATGEEQHLVMVDSRTCDEDIHDVARLLRYALLAYGFCPAVIEKILPEHEP